MQRLLLAVSFIFSALFGSGQVISDFATNVDGWTADGLPPGINYSATGGNPNGFVYSQTPGSVVLGAGTYWFPYYFNAPAKFEGNKSTYYGGNLRFDASQSTTGTPVQYSAAKMTNNAGISIYFYPATLFQPPSFGTWATFDIPLSAVSGEWRTADASTAPAATQAQILAIISDIASLQIQGLYRNANMVTRIDNVTMYPPIIVSTQPVNRTVCNGQTTTFNTLGTNNPGITYHWQFLNPSTGWNDITNTGGYTNATTATLSVNTTGNFGAGSYRGRISGTAVDDAFSNTVTLTINPLPTSPGTTGASSCSAASLTLTATGGATGRYRWYTVSSGGTAISGETSSTYTTPSLTTTTIYYVAINNGTCESARTSVTATINIPPAAPVTTGASSCSPAALTLSASGGSTGEYRWYTLATGGTAISGQTNNTYTTPVLSASATYYVSINNGTCESSRTAVTATINTPPNAPTTTGAARCGPSAVPLSASGASNGQYRWYTVSLGGTAIAGENNSTYTTPSLTATMIYYVAINNGTCESTRTSVTATINTAPTAPVTTGASSCSPAALTLSASGGSTGEYRWYTLATGGTAISGQTNNTYTTPVLSASATYYVSINNGTCESSRTAVTATINTPPNAPTTTGAARCGPSAVPLSASGASNGQYRWYTVSLGGTAIAGENNSTYTTPSLTATMIYYVAINNGTCESTRTSVTATINTAPTAPVTTGASSCSPAALTLSASGGSTGQYRWYTLATGGTAISGQTNNTYTTPVLSASATYYVSINNGTCESSRAGVTATIATPPSAPATTGASSCSPAALTLSASGGAAGQYRWYTVSSGGTAISAQTNNTFTTPVLTASATYYTAIHNGTCESSRTAVTATINTPPNAPATAGASGCVSAPIALHAMGGMNGQYRWYTVAAGGTALSGEVDNIFTTPALAATTTYFVAINNGTCESSRTSVTATVQTCAINLPPTIATTTVEAIIEGKVTVNLISLVDDPDNNLDISTLKVIVQPISGAEAFIDVQRNLVLDYTGISFSGKEKLTLEVCDLLGACSQKEIEIDVVGDIKVYNGVSPNGDLKNDFFYVQYIDVIEATKKNHVFIYNRWGDVLFDVANYDNKKNVFNGLNNNRNEIPSGTYFYKIEFTGGKQTMTGYLILKR